jgi:hemolysin activation/secretion protein
MSVTAKYAESLGNSGLVGSVSILKSQSNPKASLAPLNLQTDGQTIGLRLAYPLYKSQGNSLSLESGLAFNRTTTTLNSAPLTFDKSTVFDMNLAWINNRAFNGVNVMNFTVSKGVPGGNSLEEGDLNASKIGFNPQFSKLSFNLLRLQQIAPSWSASLYVNGQYTRDNLLVAETIVFGGIPLGRGYDNGSISGDTGLGSSIEIRKDLKINLPYTTSPLQLFSFYDYGTAVTNYNATTGAPENSKYIQSYGFGARTTFPKGTLELQYAIADLPVASLDPRPNPRILFLANYFF